MVELAPQSIAILEGLMQQGNFSFLPIFLHLIFFHIFFFQSTSEGMTLIYVISSLNVSNICVVSLHRGIS